ncbi:hypothetical protein HYY70_00680 [Candidatus Woesearchaeota archaeon]|nr:hypothetical protein [Candidatus Woesearchaeota archaeon]
MFEELRAGLDSIDAVLNEDRMSSWNGLDEEMGFDPTQEYTPDQMKRMGLIGIEVLKKSGAESKYLLLEIRLVGEESTFAKLVLRGFDVPYDSHHFIAQEFLSEELSAKVAPHFELSSRWPFKTVGHITHYDKCVEYMAREIKGLKLVVAAIGGGQFNLKNNAINLSEISRAFGPVPKEYQVLLRELFDQLVQKPAYNGYQINFG